MVISRGRDGKLHIRDFTGKEIRKLGALFFNKGEFRQKTQTFVLPAKISTVNIIKKKFPDADIATNVVRDMEAAKLDFTWEPTQRETIAKIKRKKKPDTKGHVFKTKPWKHQERGFELVVSVPSMALLWDMRTGKTFTLANAIEYLKTKGKLKRVLVVCPKHIRTNWVEDVMKHTNLRSLILGTGTKEQVASIRLDNQYTVVQGPEVFNCAGKADIIITNHDAIRNPKMLLELINFGFDMIIVDESHYFKNPVAKRTQALLELRKGIKRRYILTGTIITREPADAWSQMNFLNQFIFKEKAKTFAAKYGIYYSHGGARIYKGPVKCMMKDLWRRIDEHSSKVKITDCHDMPKRLYTTIKVELSPEERRYHDDIIEELCTEIEGDVIETTILHKIRKAIQVTSGFVYNEEGEVVFIKNPAKLEPVFNAVSQITQRGYKLILWAYYHGTMKLLSQTLEDYGIGYSMISGLKKTMSMKAKHKELYKWRQDKSCNVLLANPSMIGIGIDLQEARYMMYYENDFRYDIRAQSEARNFGNRSKTLHGEKIVVIDAVARNSADYAVLEALRDRKDFLTFINAKKLRALAVSRRTGK
jgi:SNF2 family DNA or RNA helicase